MRHGRYYLGRVIKLGELDQQRLMAAIVNSATLTIGKFTWTITDVADGRKAKIPFIYGHLSKFAREGHVLTVDTKHRKQKEAPAPNLLQASAPFVYLPTFSGIAYLHVWNEIQEDLFPRRFKMLIEATYDNFFVDCTIEPVADYRAFSKRLEELDVINQIAAKVHPPNPLFGQLWGPLKDYIKKRNAQEIEVREMREDGRGLSTKIVELVRQILAEGKQAPIVEVDVTDAAILMAADGYGHAKLTGQIDGREVVVRTSEAQHSFSFEKAPSPELLAQAASEKFEEVSKQRNMRH